jgi:hypothetical protein
LEGSSFGVLCGLVVELDVARGGSCEEMPSMPGYITVC